MIAAVIVVIGWCARGGAQPELKGGGGGELFYVGDNGKDKSCKGRYGAGLRMR